jgi:hypothetical protein
MVGLAVATSAAMAQDVRPVPQETAQVLGKLMAKAAAGIKKPQVEIEGDPSQTMALAVMEANGGILLVPQKGLNEEKMPDMTGKNGAPLALLFSSTKLVPVIDGKLIDRDKLYSLNVDDGRGISEINCILLSVRRVSDEDYRLYGFGKAAKPLIDAEFTGGDGPGAQPVTVRIKEGNPAQVMVTVFGKYQATFPGGIVE